MEQMGSSHRQHHGGYQQMPAARQRLLRPRTGSGYMGSQPFRAQILLRLVAPAKELVPEQGHKQVHSGGQAGSHVRCLAAPCVCRCGQLTASGPARSVCDLASVRILGSTATQMSCCGGFYHIAQPAARIVGSCRSVQRNYTTRRERLGTFRSVVPDPKPQPAARALLGLRAYQSGRP